MADDVGKRGRRPAPLVLAAGLLGGFFSGLLGIGGGTVMVPLLVLAGGIGQRAAHAMSLAAMVPIATVALVVYGAAGKVDLAAGAALASGAVFGARVGASLLERIPEWGLKTIFGGFLLVTALLLAIGG